MMFISAFAVVASVVASTVPTGPEVTIYNQGFGVIKDTRELALRKGVQDVIIEGVAQRIETDSVAIRSLSNPGSFTVREQNYRYDLISPIAILNKAVGQKITLNRVLPNGVKESIVGTLLTSPTAIVTSGGTQSQTYQGMVIQTDDGRILLDPAGEIEVRTIPDGLISKPTLVWEVDSASEGTNLVELSYLTQGISWTCNYTLSLGQDGKSGDFKGWVTLNNQSGATYKDARLKLLAGEVQRTQANRAGRGGPGAPMKALADTGGFAEEQFSDYHLYSLQRTTTVRNNEQKQVSLLEAVGVPVVKRLVLDAMQNYQGWRANEGEIGTGVLKPQIRIEFSNDEKSKMGMPLPQGTIKVFQRDRSGSLQMLGEDAIDHTPKNEKLSLVVGRAFDVVAERKRTKFSYLRDAANNVRGATESFEIEIRNRKDTDDSIDIIERFWGEWTVDNHSDPFTKLSNEAMMFTVPIKANSVRKVTFAVTNRW